MYTVEKSRKGNGVCIYLNDKPFLLPANDIILDTNLAWKMVRYLNGQDKLIGSNYQRGYDDAIDSLF